MTFDPKAKTIKYSKENTDKEFELSCEPITGEEMYFCCTLNTQDEAVSIVPWYFACIDLLLLMKIYGKIKYLSCLSLS